MMSTRALLACALLLGALLPGQASADPPRGALVVEGKGNSTGELVLTSAVFLRSPLPALAGGGDYAAVLLEPVTPAPGRARLLGAVTIRAFGDRTGEAVATLGVDGRLDPGRYRVTLLGQGPVRATFSLADDQAPGVRVVPRTPAKVQFLGRADRLEIGVSGARIDVPGGVPARRRAVQVALLDGTHLDDLRMCATTAASCPGPAQPTAGVLPVTGGQIAAAVVEPEGQARALRWSVEGVRGSVERLRTAALIF